MRYETTADGNRPWLVFCHSLACRLDMWQPQVAAFSRDFNVLAYDVRGHGGTDAPSGEYSLDLFADDLAALLVALKIEKCHFVGLSMGGMIGQVAALKMPALFSSLVIADSTGQWPADSGPIWAERIRQGSLDMTPMAEPFLKRWFSESFLAERPDVEREVRRWIVETPRQGFVGACHAISKVDTLAALASLNLPALVMVGEWDPGTPPAMSRKLHAALAGSHYLEIPEARHLGNIEKADFFNDALRSFYAEINEPEQHTCNDFPEGTEPKPV